MADTLDVVMNDKTHRFEVTVGADTAFAEFRLAGDSIVLPHTVVPDAFAGQGVGSLLARTALTYARDHGLTVKPSCPFIAGYIQKHPEWQDLVDPAFRARLGL